MYEIYNTGMAYKLILIKDLKTIEVTRPICWIYGNKKKHSAQIGEVS